MSPDEIHKMITQRLAKSRPEAWEEDISRNTLDTMPFENLPAPCERPMADFDQPHRRKLIEPLLAGRLLESMVKRDPFPIPCPEDREGYSPGQDGFYWLSGLEDHLKILDAAARHHVDVQSVFDFGCATGRVLRHFAAQTDIPAIWGSDINARHIRWLYEYLPLSVRPIFNHCIPTLPMRDGSIDVITAFSVFTHIDTFETHWLAELSRILSDQGMCYLTVHNEDTWNSLADQLDNPNNRLVQSMLNIDPAVRDQLQAPLPENRLVYRFSQSGPYRAQVFHSNHYLQRVWGRFFSIEEILPLYHARQTVLVLKKK